MKSIQQLSQENLLRDDVNRAILDVLKSLYDKCIHKNIASKKSFQLRYKSAPWWKRLFICPTKEKYVSSSDLLRECPVDGFQSRCRALNDVGLLQIIQLADNNECIVDVKVIPVGSYCKDKD